MVEFPTHFKTQAADYGDRTQNAKNETPVTQECKNVLQNAFFLDLNAAALTSSIQIKEQRVTIQKASNVLVGKDAEEATSSSTKRRLLFIIRWELKTKNENDNARAYVNSTLATRNFVRSVIFKTSARAFRAERTHKFTWEEPKPQMKTFRSLCFWAPEVWRWKVIGVSRNVNKRFQLEIDPEFTDREPEPTERYSPSPSTKFNHLKIGKLWETIIESPQPLFQRNRKKVKKSKGPKEEALKIALLSQGM